MFLMKTAYTFELRLHRQISVADSVVDPDPDPHGSGTFAWIWNYCYGSGSSKI